MAMFNLLKIRTSTDIFKNEKCKVTFGLEYILVINGISSNLANTFPSSRQILIIKT